MNGGWALVALLAAGVPAIAGATLVWLRRRYVVIDIVGVSMEPSYSPGGRVLVRRTSCAGIRTGQAVVFQRLYGSARVADAAAVAAAPGPDTARRPLPVSARDGERSWLLKRAVAVPGDPIPRDRIPALRDTPDQVVPDGCLVVLGDNPKASLDSRQFGYVRQEHVLGVVVRHMSPSAEPSPPA